jgi:hypothetical protein
MKTTQLKKFLALVNEVFPIPEGIEASHAIQVRPSDGAISLTIFRFMGDVLDIRIASFLEDTNINKRELLRVKKDLLEQDKLLAKEREEVEYYTSLPVNGCGCTEGNVNPECEDGMTAENQVPASDQLFKEALESGNLKFAKELAD